MPSSLRRQSTMKTEVACREITVDEARGLPPIPSGFTTSRILHLRRWTHDGDVHWSLSEEVLPAPVRQVYDHGDLEDWLPIYAEGEPSGKLRFIEARCGDVLGLLTWKFVEWNNTVWLADVRVREDRRRQGVGSELLKALKREARALNARGVTVETQIRNVPAVRFYERHGFRISGFNDALYVNQGMKEQDVALFLFWPA